MVQATKRAVLYCRVSTTDQDCGRQERDLLSFCERGGFQVVSIYKETASGTKTDRAQRKQVMALAQARKVDVIVISEMSRWGRSLQDIITTLNELKGYGVSLITEKGEQFDLSSPNGKLIASLLGILAEWERDIIVERVRSGMAAAKARKVRIGRPPGKTSDKHAPKVLAYLEEKRSIRWIAKDLQISKTTVMDIKNRAQRKTA